ncbi:lytic murein transglycosylase [Gordonia sinesedis]
MVSLVTAVMLLSACSSRLGQDEEKPEEREVPSLQLKAWSELHAGPYDVPERALRSYAYASAAMNKANPGCGIGWSTLAAIGDVSSDNGTASGASIDPNGRATPELRDLTQANPRNAEPIADTDAGRYDGSSRTDVTMGPMQILPSRWEQFATDADNDGKADPDNIDDATLTAARFLCASGGDLRQSDGWARAVSQFNSTPGFLQKVHAQAAIYGR